MQDEFSKRIEELDDKPAAEQLELLEEIVSELEELLRR